MAENKTQKTNQNVRDYLNSIEDEQRRTDCTRIYEIMKKVTGHEGRMWGDSMVGFGEYHYKYDSGREGNFFISGFSNRKNNISLYMMCSLNKELLANFGKHTTGKSCIYIKKLDDVNQDVLKDLIRNAYKETGEKFEIVEGM